MKAQANKNDSLLYNSTNDLVCMLLM